MEEQLRPYFDHLEPRHVRRVYVHFSICCWFGIFIGTVGVANFFIFGVVLNILGLLYMRFLVGLIRSKYEAHLQKCLREIQSGTVLLVPAHLEGNLGSKLEVFTSGQRRLRAVTEDGHCHWVILPSHGEIEREGFVLNEILKGPLFSYDRHYFIPATLLKDLKESLRRSS